MEIAGQEGPAAVSESDSRGYATRGLLAIAAGLLAWSVFNAPNTLGGNKRRPAS
jgi:hypothetical protein